jgi:2-dehydro-3-deoxygluconokinase
VDADKYRFVCEELARQFPNLKSIAITLRGSISANHNTWSGILWDSGDIYTAPVYQITQIVDRVGTGDAFMGALIYAFKTKGYDKQRTLNFAVAASCLKHSVFGDFNLVSITEIEKMLAGDVSGRVIR